MKTLSLQLDAVSSAKMFRAHETMCTRAKMFRAHETDVYKSKDVQST